MLNNIRQRDCWWKLASPLTRVHFHLFEYLLMDIVPFQIKNVIKNLNKMLSVVRRTELRRIIFMYRYKSNGHLIILCWLVTFAMVTPHLLYTCSHSYYRKNHSGGELRCSLSVGRNRKSSCENVCSFISGEMGGKYKRLQLVEMHSLEILFVLGTDTKHQCKWWARQANKQTG